MDVSPVLPSVYFQVFNFPHQFLCAGLKQHLVRWDTPIIPATQNPEAGVGSEFEACLGTIVRPCLRKGQKNRGIALREERGKERKRKRLGM